RQHEATPSGAGGGGADHPRHPGRAGCDCSRRRYESDVPRRREVAARFRRGDPHRLGHHPGPCQSAGGRRLTRQSGRRSSARASNIGGTSGPSAFAVLRLITSAWPLAGYGGSGMPRARTAPTTPASAIIVSTAMKTPDAETIAPRATPAPPPRKVEAVAPPAP